ncbi:hypothetical protein BS78_K294700 [Paspalum vaginatum]|uniref:Uncharacterized protein n=1 Tax=Paspalum vaginatum TaxID=158149 RepID=A0A9W7X9Z2_9POAL|nr:hypothetical protein BS78_K294700 [Paspalum vaginatum]
MAKDMLDLLEKAMGAPGAQVQEIARGGGQDLLTPDLAKSGKEVKMELTNCSLPSWERNIEVEAGGVVVVAAKMSPGLKNWRLPYWLVAGSVIFAMTNHIQAAPKYEQLVTPGLVMTTMLMLGVFLCANCMIFRAM